MPRKKPITAAELIAKCEADPQWVAARDAREAARQKAAEEYRRAEAPLLRDLRSAGFDVGSVWDLVNTSVPYPKALPILVRHLAEPYPDVVREGIARALAVLDAGFAWPVLAAAYQSETGPRSKDGLAVALAASADEQRLGDLLALAENKRNGASRILLLNALERSRISERRKLLERLRRDTELQHEVDAIFKRDEQKERRLAAHREARKPQRNQGRKRTR